MSVKKSVLLDDHTVQIFEANRDPDTPIAWSRQVNRGIVIGDWLFKSSLPELTDGEWSVILSVYAGTCGSLEHPPYRIASDMMDDQGVIDINDHTDADLVKRIHGMSQAEQYAILTFNERYWNRDWSEYSSFEEIINAIITAGTPLKNARR